MADQVSRQPQDNRMRAAEIRRSLECGKPSCQCASDRSTRSHCPSHEDTDPSCSITDGTTAPLLHCFTGCQNEDIITALKAKGVWPEREQTERRTWREPSTVYRYVDDTGNLVGEKGRMEWVDRSTGEMKKTFVWRLPGSQTWGGLNGLVMPLYNLPDVLKHPDAAVWIVEGEKAAQSLQVRGLVAVCGYSGASQTLWDDSLSYLDGRDIILWPDNDAVGFGLMGRMLHRFPGARIIRPDLPEKADAYDYFEMGGTVEALAEATRVEILPIAACLSSWSSRFTPDERYTI